MKTYVPILICISLLICSCNPYRFIDIQTLNPSSVKLPKGNFTMVIVDPEKTGYIAKDSISFLYSKLAINSFNREFEKKVRQSPIFQEAKINVMIAPPLTFSSDSLRKYNYMDSLWSMYSKEKDDMLILRYGFKILYFKYPAYDRWDRYSPIYFNYKLQFILSDLKTKRVCDSYQTSLYNIWENENNNDSSSNPVVDAFKCKAESYACRVAPYWSTEERQLAYYQNKWMRKAYNYFCDNNLDKAVETWKHLYEVGTRKLSARAAFNIALVYEIKDDLDACENWLIKSNLKKLDPSTRYYLDLIRKRKLERITIDNQF